jgi:hypothetical protein
MYRSTTASLIAYITAVGPCRRTSGSSSSRWRTSASGLAAPWRTVTTNESPMKSISSPAETVAEGSS